MKLLIGLASFCFFFSGGWCYGNDTKILPTDEFIIAPKKGEQKKVSQRTLKERIGTATKHVLDSTTQINQVMGELQSSLAQRQLSGGVSGCTYTQCFKQTGDMYQMVATLQRQCTSIAEKLIDNEPPFKKASRNNLQKALESVDMAQRQLHERWTMLSKIAVDSKKPDASNHSTKLCCRTDAELKQLQTVMTNITSTFRADECLKHI